LDKAGNKRKPSIEEDIMLKLLKSLTILAAGFLFLIMTGCSGDSNSPLDPGDGNRGDNAPPAPPTGMHALAETSTVKVSWQANTTDTDLAGYLVYRTFAGVTRKLTEDPIQATNYTDEQPLRGSCTYGVTSVDHAGNESAWQQYYLERNPDLPEWEETYYQVR
jgi:hypothetical protein